MDNNNQSYIRHPKERDIPIPEFRIIKTQQGFSQHTLKLSLSDAKIYTDLLDKYKIWWADVTKHN